MSSVSNQAKRCMSYDDVDDDMFFSSKKRCLGRCCDYIKRCFSVCGSSSSFNSTKTMKRPMDDCGMNEWNNSMRQELRPHYNDFFENEKTLSPVVEAEEIQPPAIEIENDTMNPVDNKMDTEVSFMPNPFADHFQNVPCNCNDNLNPMYEHRPSLPLQLNPSSQCTALIVHPLMAQKNEYMTDFMRDLVNNKNLNDCVKTAISLHPECTQQIIQQLKLQKKKEIDDKDKENEKSVNDTNSFNVNILPSTTMEIDP
ncbi:hypothetical protein WA158_002914 [Blastocystis sp. Blastoise]